MRKVDTAKYEQKRVEILEAAGRCFAREGFQGSTIANICSEAKISPGHLYHYFASKEAIVDAIFQVGLKTFTKQFNDMGDNSNAIDQLTSKFEQADSDRSHGHHFEMLDILTEAGRNEAMAVLLREHSGIVAKVLSGFLRNAQAKGQVDQALDPDLAALVMMSLFDAYVTMKIRDPGASKTKTMQLWKILITRFLTPPTKI